ncbi:SGNH/GDSL hydrolase family protein [Aeromicrobium sp. CF4.19]|uniref:SGNH/GDSL hydrolase family protein n=1 Tax=Aeromicrobium sp. CF4.19 TaxID=3373082 RepID=UPI003EE4D9DC
MTTDRLPFATPITADFLRGALDVERTELGILPHRLPANARAQLPDGQVAMAESLPSGVRLVLRTSSTVIELETRPTKVVYEGAPARPDGIYELLVDGEPTAQGVVPQGSTMTIDLQAGSARTTEGPTGTVRFDRLPATDKIVEVWLPHNETTELVALHTDATVEPAPRPTGRTWLHHGSSISHGSNATHPTGTWPAVAAARAGVELVNLGLGGSALLDPFTARAMRDAPADVISVKIGINIVNTDLMRLRAFVPAVHGFLDTIREGHPDTPLLVVSAIGCPIHEGTPGPCAPDFSDGTLRFVATGDPDEVPAGKLTLRVVRDQLERIVAHRATTDPALRHLDGTDLYGDADASKFPLPDALHPDAATHVLIGERFANVAFGDGGAFDHG